MSTKVVVAGVGMIPFTKPGASEAYHVMGAQAARLALADAGVDYARVQQAYVGFVYGDSTSGQAALYPVGMTGIPVINVNNNCSTGSTALFLARQAVASGAADCVLALGFEQMTPGALAAVFHDRPSPFANFEAIADATLQDNRTAPTALRLFGGAGYEHQQKYGTRTETFAKVRAKASLHAVHNEKAIFRSPLTVEDVMASPQVFLNLTRLQCCPPTCGAAAAVLCSPAFAARHGLNADVVIVGQAMTTDAPASFDGSMIRLVGFELTRAAAQAVYEDAGLGPQDVDVCELHDCFATNELITYEGLDLCPEGEGEAFVWDGDNTYGGAVVTNPSGGLLSKGHPLGATGLSQCAELVWQLRGQAGPRQVEGARIGLQHNLGLGGACVVTAYARG
ncbi:MAG TPA: lipid-transfer protein [Phenylobacterium sp.]